MATYTSNYNLVKPDQTDYIDISALNGNMDTIDQQMKANSSRTLSVVLPAADWVADQNSGTGYTLTVTATGVTSSCIVFVSPADASYTAYTEASVRASAQGANSLTFVSDDTPASDLTVNVVLMGV